MFSGRNKIIFIVVTIIGCLALIAGLSVLIYWLVTRNGDYQVISIEGDGVGDLPYSTAFTRIRNAGDMFWWFYPTVASNPNSRPIILWLDGIMGDPPSFLANFGMFGPYDMNLNRRQGSWINDFNLLFIDAPLNTGFSKANDDANSIPTDLDGHAEHLAITVESFFDTHEAYASTPLYIFGQASGAQLALSLVIKLIDTDRLRHNLRGVALGNGIISPAIALTKLAFYLEELGYIDDKGRNAIQRLSTNTTSLVHSGQLEDAFDNFISLGDFVNEEGGAVAVNLGYIVEKLTRETSRDYFGHHKYLQEVFGRVHLEFMDNVVGPALGMPSDVSFDSGRESAVKAFRPIFMAPSTDKIEYILENTDLTVSIYNGNLDAISNTPGQLEWVDNLQWSGQTEFRNTARQTLVINGFVEGYFRETQRLKFYWITRAGQSVPIDNPTAMNRILRMIVN